MAHMQNDTRTYIEKGMPEKDNESMVVKVNIQKQLFTKETAAI